jgi:PTS system N-acetylglucosamine-specific IIC component
MDAAEILKALGGKENVTYLDSCITRLRITLADQTKMDERALRVQGAVGIVKLGGGNVQVVLGTDAEFIEQEIKEML